MEITETTPRVEKKIKGHVFQVPAPFDVGHITTEATTNMLNQTYKENVGNNFAPTIQKALDDKTFDLADMQAQLDKYVLTYIPGVRPAGTGGTRGMTAVEKRVFAMVREIVVKAIKAKGLKITGDDGCGPAHVNKLVKQQLAKSSPKLDAIRTEAERQVAATKDFALEDLQLEE